MKKPVFKYYLMYRENPYRLFSLSMDKEGTIALERRFPAKDSNLSRKRGVKYESSKETFVPEWKEAVEYLGCVQIPLDRLAPCRKEDTDESRTFTIPNNQEGILVHLVVIVPGHEKEFENYLPPSAGSAIGRRLEKEVHPNVGILITA